jgi:2-oxoglutarate dehydrogenase E2 component (dihydrolipoamide succinyltransferase)
MKLRSDYKDEFVKKHGVKLGLMSCFVKVLSNVMDCQTIAC